MDVVLSILCSLICQQSPVPDAEKQADAEKMIRDVFKAEYAAKGVLERAILARKLLEQGQESTDSPATRYVLLREARELAAQAGDLDTSVKAIDLLAAAYAVDFVALKSSAFQAVGKTVRTPEEIAALAAAYFKLVEEASARDQYDQARQAADSAGALARRLKDMALVSKAEAKAKEATARRDKYAKINKAQETLAAAPDDPEANLLVGQFECLVKGDWERGLPRLLKGPEGVFKALAGEELAAPTDPLAQIKLGDAWWELAEKADGWQKAGLQERARHWYRLALPEAQGLTRAKIEGRLKGLWIPLFDGRTLGFVKESSRPFWEVLDGVLCKKQNVNEGLQSRQLFQDGEFRLKFEVQGLKYATFSVRQGVGGKDCVLFIEPQARALEGKVHELLFQCRGAEVKAFLDGEPATLYSRGPVTEGHLQVSAEGPTLKIYSLEYRAAK
jgi:hypothetical protein